MTTRSAVEIIDLQIRPDYQAFALLQIFNWAQDHAALAQLNAKPLLLESKQLQTSGNFIFLVDLKKLIEAKVESGIWGAIAPWSAVFVAGNSENLEGFQIDVERWKRGWSKTEFPSPTTDTLFQFFSQERCEGFVSSFEEGLNCGLIETKAFYPIKILGR